MDQIKPIIVLTGGGSGGHIVPILSLAHELKQQQPGCEIIYVGHKCDNFDSLNLPKHDFDFLAFLNAGKFRRYHGESVISQVFDIKTIALNVRDLFRVLKSTVDAYKLLRKTKTNVVFCKGGFVSVPVGLAAKLQGIPIITHDSDTLGGLANKIVGRWARVKATGMPTKYYKKTKAKLVYVGIPVDARIHKVSKADQAAFKLKLGLKPSQQVLLVAGGGLGSQKLNSLMTAIAPRLLQSNLSLVIVHLTGQSNLDRTKKDYSTKMDLAELKRIKCLGFTPDFYNYSGAADLIISRAGATALAEFQLQAKTCIIIPSPFLAGGHQLKNAKVLSDAEAAIILHEDAQPDELLELINQLLTDEDRRYQLAQNMHKLAKPGAAAKLASIIIDNAKRK